MFEPVIAPSGTLLGLLQRGRGDGTLHALAAPRPEALAALDRCVLGDPRQDWQVENRSLYYARLYLDLDGPLGEIEAHLFSTEDLVDDEDHRTGLALSVLGHLASYGRDDALMLLRRYAASGANWAWALDELALRDDDEGLRSLGAAVIARFPATAEGESRLAAAVRDAYEPRPWCLWEESPQYGERLRAARQQGSFDRWQRQLNPSGPRPGWGVQAVFDWAADGLRRGTPLHVPAARCLAAVAAPEDRTAIFEAAAGASGEAARATALHHLVLAEPENPAVLDLIEAAGDDPAVAAYERMCGPAAVERARRWIHRPDALGAAAAATLASRGGAEDSRPGARRPPFHGPRRGPRHPAAVRPGRRGGPASPSAAQLPCCATSTARRPRRTCAAGPHAPSPARTRPSRRASRWNACGTARRPPERWPPTTRRRPTPASHRDCSRLATDPAEEEEVQSAVRSRIAPESAV